MSAYELQVSRAIEAMSHQPVDNVMDAGIDAELGGAARVRKITVRTKRGVNCARLCRTDANLRRVCVCGGQPNAAAIACNTG